MAYHALFERSNVDLLKDGKIFELLGTLIPEIKNQDLQLLQKATVLRALYSQLDQL